MKLRKRQKRDSKRRVIKVTHKYPRSRKYARKVRQPKEIQLDEYSSSAGYGGWGHDE